MKKLLLLSALIFGFSSAAFTELASPHRVYEFGLNVQAGVSNNYFRPDQILKEEIKIDLKKMAESFDDEGFVVDMEAGLDSYFKIDYSKNCRLKFFMGLDGAAYGNISRELFEMLGKGISANTNKKVDINMYGDLFIQTGFSVKTDIKNFGIRVTPCYFVPVVHIAQTNGYLKYTSSENGLIRAKADVAVNVYSIVNWGRIKEQATDTSFILDTICSAVRNGGFDVELEVEYPVTRTLDLGVYSRIPVVAGVLNNKASTHYWGYFEQTNLFGVLDDSSFSKKEYGHDKITYSECKIKVHRPFRTGIEGAWRPFGDWCNIQPKLGMVILNPYSPQWKPYCEWSLNADITFLKFFGLKFGTAWEHMVYKQTYGLMFNARAVELDLGLQLRGADFANCFGKSGLTVMVGIKAGW